MKPWLIPIAFSIALLPAAGCLIEHGDDDGGDDICAYDEAAATPLRNPFTGQCELFGGGGGGCDDVYYPTGADDRGTPWPAWAACYSQCEQLDETTCIGASGCVAAYVHACPSNADCVTDYQVFAGCWAAAPQIVPELPCGSLAAEACNSRTDCSPVYSNQRGTTDTSIPWQFTYCAVENGPVACRSNDDCADEYECNTEDYCLPPPGCGDPGDGACPPVCYGMCVPEANGCDLIDCRPGYHCEVTCIDDDGTTPCRPDDLQCGCDATCVPDGSNPVGECTGITTCPTLPPACPSDTTPGIANGCWTGYCIPLAECGHDPGTCRGEVACDSLPPACPAGTVPGVRGACWSGYCIPRAACEPPATCEQLTSESACRSRGDCAPVYEGLDCTCRPDGCECRDHRFSRCESAPPRP